MRVPSVADGREREALQVCDPQSLSRLFWGLTGQLSSHALWPPPVPCGHHPHLFPCLGLFREGPSVCCLGGPWPPAWTTSHHVLVWPSGCGHL